MNNKFGQYRRQIASSGAALFLACSSSYAANNFEVLEGSFFMAGVSQDVTIIGPDTAITTSFSDDPPVFLGGFNCTSTTVPSPDANCLTTNPDTTATNNGLDSFVFFGQPVFSYFAATGVDAPSTPHPAPSIDVDGGGTTEFGSFYANWNGTEFNQGAGPSKGSSVSVTDNFDGTYTLAWSSLINGGPFDGFTGDWTMKLRCLTCVEVEPGPSADLSITQPAESAETTRTVLQGGGNFTVDTDIADTTGYVFIWTATDPAILGGLVSATDTLVIDPSSIPVGTYQIFVTTQNENVTPILAAASSIVVNVVASGDLADLGDRDNDGVQNSDDAIDNLLDPSSQQAQPGNGTDYLLASSEGKLVIGRTAACVNSQSATVQAEDVQTSGAPYCQAPDNGVDNTTTVRTGIGGYFDFQVKGLAQGAQVDVVIPVLEAIPPNASYRTYQLDNGWQAFTIDNGDAIASAAGSPGVCPAPGASEWSDGLTAGHNCIRLSITDGGANDADRSPNGVVSDPGAVSYNPGIDVGATTVGGGFGLLLGLPLFWLRRFKPRR